MYHNKETFKKLASRTSNKLSASYLAKCLGKMSKKPEVQKLIDLILPNVLSSKLDNTRCFDILSNQIYGYDWNFISSQFKANESRLIESKKLIQRFRDNDLYEILTFNSDEYSSLNEKQFLAKLFSLIKFNNAKVTLDKDSFDCGESMLGKDYVYSFRLSIYHPSIEGTNKVDFTGELSMNVDPETGEILSISASSNDLELDVDYKQISKLIGRKYKSLQVYTLGRENYFIVAKQYVGQHSYHQLIETLALYEDDALSIVDELSKVSSEIMILDKYHLSADFAWNLQNDEPATQHHGNHQILVKTNI